MHLSHRQIQRSNNLRFLIDKYCIVKAICKNCNGTGLRCYNYTEHNGIKDYSWDGHSYCDHCEGLGYTKWGNVEKDGWNLCPSCNGFGCEKCSHNGVVDWVKFITIEGNKENVRHINKNK